MVLALQDVGLDNRVQLTRVRALVIWLTDECRLAAKNHLRAGWELIQHELMQLGRWVREPGLKVERLAELPFGSCAVASLPGALIEQRVRVAHERDCLLRSTGDQVLCAR